ncbi:unnamed protein product [Notodromas monacha]|uniref:Chitin-binding type-2 domain-containing protein n=1 Tax=Notodromas monacha TaxID=399045 RepID=A0A7R9C046_9CRUS|nr:unnamed protein product [Notodromas monacha]CAG0923693.1 unnamed protein product [Notodromas monacha]
MKVLGFVILFVTIASAKPAERSSVSDQCPSIHDPNSLAVHLADPEDCEKYYVCDWGQAISMPCPSGLHFNPTLHVCDWPENAGCTAGQNPTTEAPATEEVTEPHEEPTTVAEEITTVAGEEEQTTVGEEEEVTTEAGEETTVAEEETTVAGEETTVAGEETTVADEEHTTQAEEATTTEAAVSEEETEKPVEEENKCPATGTAILPNPEDCASFFVCDNGEPFLVTCPAGKAFSTRYSSCVEAAQDGCTPATESPEITTEAETEEPTTTTAPETEAPTTVTTQKPTTQKPTTQKPTTQKPTTQKPTTQKPTTQKPTTQTPTTQKPTTQKPTTVGKQGCEKVTCPGQNDQFALHLPNPDDCGSFCKCDWGTAHHFDCPGGLHFNAALQVCDWPASAGCQVASRGLLLLEMNSLESIKIFINVSF